MSSSKVVGLVGIGYILKCWKKKVTLIGDLTFEVLCLLTQSKTSHHIGTRSSPTSRNEPRTEVLPPYERGSTTLVVDGYQVSTNGRILNGNHFLSRNTLQKKEEVNVGSLTSYVTMFPDPGNGVESCWDFPIGVQVLRDFPVYSGSSFDVVSNWRRRFRLKGVSVYNMGGREELFGRSFRY